VISQNSADLLSVSCRVSFFVAVFMFLNVSLDSLMHAETILTVRPDRSNEAALLASPTWIENPK
jgi:hypothetical protein